MPALRVHPVLGKWLYLAASVESFEDDGRRLAELALADDARVGVEPQARRRAAGSRRKGEGPAARRRTPRGGARGCTLGGVPLALLVLAAAGYLVAGILVTDGERRVGGTVVALRSAASEGGTRHPLLGGFERRRIDPLRSAGAIVPPQ
jgi:hypothetical protein